MFCQKCGKELDERAKFCPNCGAMVEAPVSEPAAPDPAPVDAGAPAASESPAPPVWPDPAAPEAQAEAPAPVDAGAPAASESPVSPVWPDPAAPESQAGAPAPADAEPPAPPVWPAPPVPEAQTGAPAPKGGGRKTGIVVGAVAAVAVVVLAVVLLIGRLGGGDSPLEKAFRSTADAYTEAVEAVGLPDLRGLYEDRKYSQTVELSLVDVDLGDEDAAMLEGFGLRWGLEADVPGKKIATWLTPCYGAADLLTAQLVLEGSGIYAGSPELTNGAFYGVDTRTLGADLQAMGVPAEEIGDLHFDLFELIETIRSRTGVDGDSQAAAAEALYDAIQVEEAGQETIDVNGHSTECSLFRVTVPRDALETYLQETGRTTDYQELFQDILADMGLPEAVLDELRQSMDDAAADPAEAYMDAIRQGLDAIGDVVLQVYVGDGRVSAVTWSGTVEAGGDTEAVELGIYLGGGERYVDDFSLVVDLGGGEARLVLTSTGDHGAQGGALTDTTTLSATSGGVEMAAITSQLRYAAKEDQDNFSWTLSAEGYSLSLSGQIAGAEDALTVDLDEIALAANDGSHITAAMTCQVGAYTDTVDLGTPTMVLQMDEEELEALGTDLGNNAVAWLMGVIFQVPGLADLMD